MGLLPILLLFSCCSLGSSVPVPATDVDCDNKDIFEAVDEALKSYNEAKVDGHKFILYRITEAKIKQENESLTHQFVSFEIRESVCPLKAETSWKQCDYKSEDGERGECSAHVLVDITQNTKKVVSQNCSIFPKAVEPTVSVAIAPCVGCYAPIDPTNEELSTIIQSAIEKVNKIANHPFFFELQKVTNAERQVISGWIYKLDMDIRQTNCSKSDYTTLNIEKCKAVIDGDRGNCSTKVFLTPNGEVKDIFPECFLSTGICLQCPLVLDKNDPEIQAFTMMFIDKYNLKNHTNLYNVAEVTEATSTMKIGKKQYRLQLTLQTTNCSKSNHAVLGDECAIEQQSDPLTCHVTIDVVKETTNILPDYICLSGQKGRRATIKGFSPLRSVIPPRSRRASEKSRGKGHGQNQHKEEKHEKIDKKEKKDHDKKKDHEKQKDHKKKKDHSSEESEEDHRKKPESPPSKPGLNIVTQRPIVTEKVADKPAMQPPTPIIPEFLPSTNQGILTPDVSPSTLTTAIPDNKSTLPTINETVLDFLPPLTIAKCPGKVWQPLFIIPELATEKTFIIDDLLSAADDLEPPKDQNPSTDLSTTSFTDEELVINFDF